MYDAPPSYEAPFVSVVILLIVLAVIAAGWIGMPYRLRNSVSMLALNVLTGWVAVCVAVGLLRWLLGA